MKVIHLPVNISSQISTTVRALRSLGVEARGLVRHFSSIQDHTGVEALDWSGDPKPFGRLWRGLRWRWKMVRAMAWTDVVHWHWGDTTWKGIDLRIAARLGKPRLVEFWGDDLREPAIASRDNDFIAKMYRQHPELANQRSKPVQQMFSRNGFACLIPGYELADYLNPSLFPGYYQTRPRVFAADFTPDFPDPSGHRPLLVHAPSDKARKGTEAVLAAVAALQKTHSFDFKLIHQMPRNEALATVARADLFLDQFTVGAEGLAALEAMALGKPVVCFIKNALQGRYPVEVPIVVCDQNTLASTIAPLIENAEQRHKLGVESRNYVETYHDALKVSAELIEIYEDLALNTHNRLKTWSGSDSMHWHVLSKSKTPTEPCVP
jgi:hypothetical protein